jgi:hypothetical protein
VLPFSLPAFSYAQDIDQAKKRSTPKSTKRKITLKSIIKSDPDEGLAHFLLGNVYLTQRVVDSAKLVIKMSQR